MTAIDTVLFDLDGTLLDTAQDLGRALNNLLHKRALPAIPLEKIRPSAGRGSRGLLKLGLDVKDNDERFVPLAEQFLIEYEKHLLDTTVLFAGMEEVLAFLEKNNLTWGIVTNKPEKYTFKILEGLQLMQRAKCIISGDSLANRKPHPEPILHACKLLGKKPEQCLYVGDSHIDIIASKAAGTTALAALYGYIPAEENPKTWNADGYIHHPVELISWIEESN